ncbi:hypothetical protein BDR07DRAFT_1451060 [Suillus spraguei]|nr:hypothetical protein BDR07DRAFT_1451060 [Suillus spraguei]
MGLCIQLAISKWCILPRKAFNDDFVFIDANGIHEIGLDFCGCTTSQTHTRQLLRAGWFPSTSTNPRTATTFHVLYQYHILSFESKASAYEFYHSLDRYESFMCMVREWCHLVMLKRSGCGHDPSGVAGTSEGQCAVLCPACLQPGKNLPDNWQDAPKAKGWLCGLFLAIDANFHLKRHVEASYKSHISDRVEDTQEKSTCSSHNTVNMADTKLSQGLAAMGVGTVDCARHNMKCSNGVGDLQKGEKYLNMDYLFFSTLRHSTVDILNVSYDIACQWRKHLWSHMLSLPPSHHLNYLTRMIHFFVPKFHLPVHISKCQMIFSFNFTHFVGRTDGEAPERGWSNINPVASSMKGMGPGCHRDTLDNHFRSLLLFKIKEAQTEKAEHGAAFKEFDSVIMSENCMAWKVKMEAWEENPNDTMVSNPLQLKGIAITQASACLNLAQLKAEDLECGVDLSLHPDVSPSVLIASGIDLEEEHRQHGMDTQKLSILHMRMSLHRKTESRRRIQFLYVPPVQVLVNTSATSALENAELMKLWLPSALNGNALGIAMQFMQAHDALEELRQCLHVHCSLLNFKREWIWGQGANTWAQNVLAPCVKRYRTAWGALKSLAQILKKVDWHGRLQDLSDDDCLPGVCVEWCKSHARALHWAEEVDLLQEEMRQVLLFFNW